MAKKKRILFVTSYVPSVRPGGTSQRARTITEALLELGDTHLLLVEWTDPRSFKDRLDPAVAPLLASRTRLGDIAARDPTAWSSQLSPSLLGRVFLHAWVTTGRMIASTNTQSAQIVHAIRQQAGPQQFDMIFALQAPCALLIDGAKPRLLQRSGTAVLDWDAAEAVAIRESAAGLSQRAPATRAVLDAFNGLKLTRLEARLLGGWDAHLCASQADIPYFVGRAPGKRVTCLPNSFISPAREPEPLKPLGGSPRVVFVATMNYGPNHAGALLLLREVWPVIRHRFPDATLQLVGRGPDAQINSFDGKLGVEVIGEVESVEPYYAGCDLVVAPMTVSVGSAIKVIEALAHRRPLVAFAVSTRRHGLKDGEHVAVATSLREFCGRIIELLLDREAARAMAERGFQFVATRFSQRQVRQELVQFLAETMTPKGQAPRRRTD